MVSVIVPVYNAESTIEKCIKSICAQTYRDIEIIAIDDGSKDSSYSLLRKLQDKDARISIYKQQNKGVSYTRNYGIKLAKGEYIQFVDSDDVIKSTMTQKLVNKLVKENLDLCMCLFEYPSKSTKRIEGFTEKLTEGFYDHFTELMDNVLLQGPCNKIYKAEIIKVNNIEFPENISKLEDSIFNARYLQYCDKVGLIPEMLYCYNYVEESLSHKLHISEIEAMLVFYSTLKETLSKGCKSYEEAIFLYALRQMEVIYRVTWIQHKNDLRKYKQIWNEYENSMIFTNGFELLKPFARMSGMRHKVFFYLSRYRLFYLSILYFDVIEKIKKVVKKS